MSAPPLGSAIDAFMASLRGRKFDVSAQTCQEALTLMASLAMADQLPPTLPSRLALLRPLVCRTPDDLVRFDAHLEEWMSERVANKRRDVRPGDKNGSGPDARRRWPLAVAALVAVLVGIATFESRQGSAVVAPPPPLPLPASATSTPSLEMVTPPSKVRRTHETRGRPPDAPRWIAWFGIAGASILLLLVGSYLLRRIALSRLATTAELEERSLFGERLHLFEVPSPQLRLASRALRRMREADRRELDVHASIAATLRQGGAFAPQYRPRKETPEYVVIVERRGASDQLFETVHALVASLQRQGLMVNAYSAGTDADWLTPLSLSRDHERWAVRADSDVAHEGTLRLGQLAARAGEQRLLVFGDVANWLDPLRGGWRRGATALTTFASAAWFTPRPVGSWGDNEHWLGTQGILAMPLQLLSLVSVADWLVSERAILAIDPAWPRDYPASLEGNELAWVAGHSPPAPWRVERLMAELERFLGKARFQALCACAVFPVPSWPVSVLALHVMHPQRDTELLDLVSIACLPWLREGTWPDWVRDALRHRLAPDAGARFAIELRARLSEASLGRRPPDASELAGLFIEGSLAARLKRMWRRYASQRWLGTVGGSLTEDVVFLGFVQSGPTARLAVAVPAKLRRLLFKEGLPLLGLRPGVMACIAALGIGGLALQLPVMRGYFAGSPAPVPAAAPSTPEARAASAPVSDAASASASEPAASSAPSRALAASKVTASPPPSTARRAEVFYCTSPGDSDKRLALSAYDVIRKKDGWTATVQPLAPADWSANFSTSGLPYQVRFRGDLPAEKALAAELMRDSAFKGLAPWKEATTSRKGGGIIRVVACSTESGSVRGDKSTEPPASPSSQGQTQAQVQNQSPVQTQSSPDEVFFQRAATCAAAMEVDRSALLVRARAGEKNLRPELTRLTLAGYTYVDAAGQRGMHEPRSTAMLEAAREAQKSWSQELHAQTVTACEHEAEGLLTAMNPVMQSILTSKVDERADLFLATPEAASNPSKTSGRQSAGPGSKN